MLTSVQTLDTGLATHRPVQLVFDTWNNSEVVKWMPRPARPVSDLVVGPSIGGSFTSQWDKINIEIERAMPGGLLTFGMKHTDREHASRVDLIWDTWQALANIESRANFAVPSEHVLGGKFDIRTGSLHEAMASRLCHRASSLSAHNWAFRRVCEARADAKRSGPRGCP